MIKETITCRRTNRDGSVTEYTQERWVNTEEENKLLRAGRFEELRNMRERELNKYYRALNPSRMSDIMDCYEEYLLNVSDFRY